jgi:hypothetical protein
VPWALKGSMLGFLPVARPVTAQGCYGPARQRLRLLGRSLEAVGFPQAGTLGRAGSAPSAFDAFERAKIAQVPLAAGSSFGRDQILTAD